MKKNSFLRRQKYFIKSRTCDIWKWKSMTFLIEKKGICFGKFVAVHACGIAVLKLFLTSDVNVLEWYLCCMFLSFSSFLLVRLNDNTSKHKFESWGILCCMIIIVFCSLRWTYEVYDDFWSKFCGKLVKIKIFQLL